MSVTIWRPRRYKAGWWSDMVGWYVPNPHTADVPGNGEVAAAPYDRDTKVREIARYEGEYTLKYADTGEFSIRVPAGYCEPDDVRKGYMVEIDGHHYEIEGYTWELTDGGYTVEISGRDMGGRLDRETSFYQRESAPIRYSINGLRDACEAFFIDNWYSSDDPIRYFPEACGWFRDEARKTGTGTSPRGWVGLDLPQGEDVTTERGTVADMELTDMGAWLRTACSYHSLGYRFDLEFDASSGLHKLLMVLYKGSDNGVLLRTSDRGVADFAYTFDTRDQVTAMFFVAKARWQHVVGGGWNHSDEPIYGIYDVQFEEGAAVNFAEVAENMAIKVTDLGEVPSDNDVNAGDAIAWLESQMDDFTATANETIEFSYDNSGYYKYGQHFGLGDMVTVVDDFLGIGVTKRLVEVTKTFAAGADAKYAFKFGDERITSTEKIIKRFRELDRKTFSI